MKNVHLLVIDPQLDFCDPAGNLFVQGAVEDMQRLSKFVRDNGSKIGQIHCTLDSHHLIHIAHPVFWLDSNSNNPGPFTIITAEDVRQGKWIPAKFYLRNEATKYVETLERGGRYPLCIWPPHCLIGTPGAAIVKEVMESFNDWSKRSFSVIDFVAKGSNPLREHYSAVKAEVFDTSDPSTGLNTDLVSTLENADEILIAGEALSHCVANTLRDIADAFSDNNYVSKMTLLRDCTSPVGDPPGATLFTDMAEQFITEMTKRGMKVTTSDAWGI